MKLVNFNNPVPFAHTHNRRSYNIPLEGGENKDAFFPIQICGTPPPRILSTDSTDSRDKKQKLYTIDCYCTTVSLDKFTLEKL